MAQATWLSPFLSRFSNGLIPIPISAAQPAADLVFQGAPFTASPLLFGLIECDLSGLFLLCQVDLGVAEVIAALTCGLGKGRIGKMIDVGDAGLFFVQGDLGVQFDRHTVEFSDHQVELRQLAALFADLELLEPDEIMARLHDSILPERGNRGQPVETPF